MNEYQKSALENLSNLLRTESAVGYHEEALKEFPEPLKFTPPMLIVAGDYNQCKMLAKINRIPRHYWKNVEQIDALRGQTGSIVFWGSWYNLYRHDEIYQAAQIMIQQGKLDLFETDSQDFLHEHQRSEP